MSQWFPHENLHGILKSLFKYPYLLKLQYFFRKSYDHPYIDFFGVSVRCFSKIFFFPENPLVILQKFDCFFLIILERHLENIFSSYSVKYLVNGNQHLFKNRLKRKSSRVFFRNSYSWRVILELQQVSSEIT